MAQKPSTAENKKYADITRISEFSRTEGDREFIKYYEQKKRAYEHYSKYGTVLPDMSSDERELLDSYFEYYPDSRPKDPSKMLVAATKWKEEEMKKIDKTTPLTEEERKLYDDLCQKDFEHMTRMELAQRQALKDKMDYQKDNPVKSKEALSISLSDANSSKPQIPEKYSDEDDHWMKLYKKRTPSRETGAKLHASALEWRSTIEKTLERNKTKPLTGTDLANYQRMLKMERNNFDTVQQMEFASFQNRAQEQELEKERKRKQEEEKERAKEQKRKQEEEKERERAEEQERERERKRKQEEEKERERAKEQKRKQEEERERERAEEQERDKERTRKRKQKEEKERERKQEQELLAKQKEAQEKDKELVKAYENEHKTAGDSPSTTLRNAQEWLHQVKQDIINYKNTPLSQFETDQYDKLRRMSIDKLNIVGKIKLAAYRNRAMSEKRVVDIDSKHDAQEMEEEETLQDSPVIRNVKGIPIVRDKPIIESILDKMAHVQHLILADVELTGKYANFRQAKGGELFIEPSKHRDLPSRLSQIPNNTLITTNIMCKVNDSTNSRKRSKVDDSVVLEADLLMSAFDPNGSDTIPFVIPDHSKTIVNNTSVYGGDTHFQFEGVALYSSNNNESTAPTRILPGGVMGSCGIRNISTQLVRTGDLLSVVMNTSINVIDEAGQRKPAAFIESPSFMIPDLMCLTPARPGGPILALVLP